MIPLLYNQNDKALNKRSNDSDVYIIVYVSTIRTKERGRETNEIGSLTLYWLRIEQICNET